MYNVKQAEIADVDLILDISLDIIFSSKEIVNMEKNEMEKLVNYTEEDIRENIDNYNMVYESDSVVGVFSISDYKDGKFIDLLYVLPNFRNNGVGDFILKKMIQDNYQAIYTSTYKENRDGIKFLEKHNFNVYDNNEFKFFLKNENIKEENVSIKNKCFKDEVQQLANKYGIKYKLEII